ncbi:hypothetical protein KKB10_03910 [Patescibacteria group bacterium]|nr:hypothetical protein [Patescibacteria group bacterium]MBU1951918.1 hypothetical protein [Patescibacteria group bacterium]
MVYAITYDLNKPGQDYPGLYDHIKSLGPWLHPLDSFWLVDVNASANEISEGIKGRVDGSDHFLVIGVTSEYQGWLPKEAWAWIHNHI